ncbi:DEAD/DEAH box helicase [Macrococcus epidermidis]|uniref:DEAD/DEAH box helicase n=1 Tax=Macrococcus epidermidis TaxID=1902580 RepID=A0A327ZXS4_9STAP|nr:MULTISPECIES: DEAD/DEAH box helicase [Macrococcus]MCH4984196.1 DEAD/DEAH box helicase [Macrococcus sp. PK]RAK46886.1 DEAD/DEAH box helicase [Macrococcus epidermidis]TDM42581.1 DEAD/DEAH box helicase [Macrococcus goetzii]TDM46437.1 DEAD/DEAH box helicase [Macrococcus goetzii]TDM49923.1 DEAD/DEAH box helicase [Macrococcus goetzii]
MDKHPFELFELAPYLVEAVEDLNFNQPTEIQRRVIPKLKKETHLIGQSQTGTGKSHAFLLPLINKIDKEVQHPQIIILAPTRELAKQLYDAAEHLISFTDGIKAGLYIGGTDKNKDIQKSKVQPQIVIGTPNRIKDLAEENVLHIHLARAVVIDEADLMIDLGFLPTVDKIAANVSREAQIAVFSATIPKALHPFLNKYLSKPEFIEIEPDAKTNKNITFYLVPTKSNDRKEQLTKIMSTINPYLAIIFANSRERADEVAEYLQDQGLKVGVIHGGLAPRERTQQMKRVKNLEYQYVVASDLASRGIDIDGVSHVINYDIPRDIAFFTHRVGRTGRGNYTGVAITIYTPDEEDLINQIEKRGFSFIHSDVKNGELVEIKDRTERQSRKKKEDNIEQNLKHKLKGKKKVKPGYKKKFRFELDKLKRNEKKAHSKRTNRENKKR